MYRIEPFTANFNVQPDFNFYRIAPLHQHLNEESPASSPSSNSQKPSEKKAKKTETKAGNSSTDLDAKQKALIKALEQFHIKVDKYIQKYGGTTEKKDGKQDKKSSEKPKVNAKVDAKVEDKKKADKNQAPAKKQEKPAKPVDNKSNAKTSDSPAFAILERQSTASVTYNGLDAVLDPFGYDSKDLPKEFAVTLQCYEKDRKWLSAVNKLSSKNGVQVGNKPTGDRTIQVQIVNSGSVQLTSPIYCVPVRGRIAVWKAIGTLLGVFEFSDAALAGSTHQWLRLADDLLEERENLDFVVREACRRLAAHDFLAANDIPSLSDYVLHSLISADSKYLANNVELWVKRIDGNGSAN